jgi:hypothetical protein
MQNYRMGGQYHFESGVTLELHPRRRSRIRETLRKRLASPLPVVLGATGGLASAIAAFTDKPLAYLMLGFAGVLAGYAVYFIASSYQRLLNIRALAQIALEEEASAPSRFEEVLRDLADAAWRRAKEDLKERERRGDQPGSGRGEQERERDD